MKKSTTGVLVVLVLALVSLVGYLFYNQGQLQARIEQQQKESVSAQEASAALLAKQQKEAAAALEEAKRPKYEHRTDVLASGMLTIPSASTHVVRISVDPDVMKASRVTGRFSAIGGAGSGIEVFIFDEDNYTNWANGHKSDFLFDSGLKTVGNLDTVLPSKAGTYYVVFSNKNAFLFSRTVSTEMKLDYDKRVA